MAESDLGLVRAVDGVSPSITPNAENTDEIYRLDIKTADGMFTTPNLKGTNAQTGGLVFGQDAEGNWGYLPPGADTVVPFKQGGASGPVSLKISWKDQVVYNSTVNRTVYCHIPVIEGKKVKKILMTGRAGRRGMNASAAGTASVVRGSVNNPATNNSNWITITGAASTTLVYMYLPTDGMDISLEKWDGESELFFYVTGTSGNFVTLDYVFHVDYE